MNQQVLDTNILPTLLLLVQHERIVIGVIASRREFSLPAGCSTQRILFSFLPDNSLCSLW